MLLLLRSSLRRTSTLTWRGALGRTLVLSVVVAPLLLMGCSEDDGGNDDSGSSTGSGSSSSGGTSSGAGGASSGGTTNGSGGAGTGGATSGSGGGSGCALDACGVCDGDGSACGCTEGPCVTWVAAHNAIRRAVNDGTYLQQPQAVPPIPMMTWDPLIAAKAQEYADSVTNWDQKHSSSEFRTYASTGYSGYHGENMAIGGGEYADPNYIVGTMWGAEEATNCTGRGCGGHYTRIVWRDSVAVGCGTKENVPFTSGGKTYTGTLSICQYGPGGNIGNQEPY